MKCLLYFIESLSWTAEVERLKWEFWLTDFTVRCHVSEMFPLMTRLLGNPQCWRMFSRCVNISSCYTFITFGSGNGMRLLVEVGISATQLWLFDFSWGIWSRSNVSNTDTKPPSWKCEEEIKGEAAGLHGLRLLKCWITRVRASVFDLFHPFCSLPHTRLLVPLSILPAFLCVRGQTFGCVWGRVRKCVSPLIY